MDNIILINCHDLGRHLACYGHNDVVSPNLDGIASESVLLENSFCTAPQCSPSRAALFTGRYPHSNGMMGLAHEPFNWSLDQREKHLATILKEAAYATAHIGVQHLVKTTQEVKAFGYDEVILETDSQVIADLAIAFLEKQQGSFFLNVGFFDPHRDAKGQFAQVPRLAKSNLKIPAYLPDNKASQQEFAGLYSVIKRMDEAVGKIWHALKKQGLLDNSCLIFTTDHGLAMPRAKSTLYDPGIETALIMHVPGLELRGARLTNLISNVDLVPTLLETLGISISESIQGQSFWPLLKGEKKQSRDYIFAEKTYHTAYEPQRAVRSKTHKLIWNAEVGVTNVPADIMRSRIYPYMIDKLWRERLIFELYDLENDPDEQTNLAENSVYEEIFEDLRLKLKNFLIRTHDPLLKGPISSPYYDKALGLLLGV